MKTSDNRPAIRFTGCTDAWHHCQFNDIVITHPTKQFIKEPSLDGTIEVIQQGNEPVVGYANGSPFEEYASVTVFGDHTVSIYKPKKPFFVATDGTKILSGNNIEGNFFYFLLERYKPIPEGYKRHFTILIEQECNFPKSDEQKHIAQYMLYLDDLIERNKRKYEKLVNLKKAMLDKMFPKNGELVPEVRFAGFSGNWERRELGEICSEITRRDPYSQATVMMISASSGFIEQSVKYAFNNAGSSLTGYTLLKRGELAYNHGASKERKYGSCFSLNVDEARVPFVYHCFDVGDNNPSFVATCLNNDRIDIQLRRLVSSSARMDGLLNISFAQYKTIEIELPPIKEQEQIAMLIDKIDQLVKLYKQELGRLQNIKKAFLEKMFV